MHLFGRVIIGSLLILFTENARADFYFDLLAACRGHEELTITNPDSSSKTYRLNGIIAAGGYGVVVSARALPDGPDVALKLVERSTVNNLTSFRDHLPPFDPSFFNMDPAAREFILQHEVPGRGVLRSADLFVIPMELALSNADEIWHLPPAERLTRTHRLMVDLLGALIILGKAGIAHLDIKPTNLLRIRRASILAEQGQPFIEEHYVLADFDGSLAFGKPLRTGVFTQAYASPEQIGASYWFEDLSYRRTNFGNDAFSVGATLFYLLTKNHWWMAAGMTSAMNAAERLFPNHENGPPNEGHLPALRGVIERIFPDPSIAKTDLVAVITGTMRADREARITELRGLRLQTPLARPFWILDWQLLQQRRRANLVSSLEADLANYGRFVPADCPVSSNIISNSK